MMRLFRGFYHFWRVVHKIIITVIYIYISRKMWVRVRIWSGFSVDDTMGRVFLVTRCTHTYTRVRYIIHVKRTKWTRVCVYIYRYIACTRRNDNPTGFLLTRKKHALYTIWLVSRARYGTCLTFSSWIVNIYIQLLRIYRVLPVLIHVFLNI